jgi:hypothetical protein
VKLAEVPTAITDNLYWHVGKRRLPKRADRAAIRAVSHDAPCGWLGLECEVRFRNRSEFRFGGFYSGRDCGGALRVLFHRDHDSVRITAAALYYFDASRFMRP